MSDGTGIEWTDATWNVVIGMAFPAEYVVLGNRREQFRMAGNAVTPPAARDLVWAVADTLRGAA